MAPNTAIGELAMHRREKSTRRHEQVGIVLLAILLFVLITTLAAGGIVQLYQTQIQREKEDQLLFVGDQYRRAISSYYNTLAPGAVRRLPTNLEALLNDDRFSTPVQHLRRIYPDPMTGKPDWEFVTERGGIAGVHSRSTAVPFKVSGFPISYKNFENMPRYADWVFSIKLN